MGAIQARHMFYLTTKCKKIIVVMLLFSRNRIEDTSTSNERAEIDQLKCQIKLEYHSQNLKIF